jgi:hypothetical protein
MELSGDPEDRLLAHTRFKGPESSRAASSVSSSFPDDDARLGRERRFIGTEGQC